MDLNLERYGMVGVVIASIVGFIVLFFGYRVKKIAFFLIWFVLGFYLISELLPYISNVLPEAVSQWPMYRALIPIAGGLLVAMLGFSFERLCVAGICFALAILVTVQYFGNDIQHLLIGGVVGVVLAGVALMSMKPATILATSVAGAYMLSVTLMIMVPNINQDVAYFPTLVGLSAVGAVAQFITTRRIE